MRGNIAADNYQRSKIEEILNDVLLQLSGSETIRDIAKQYGLNENIVKNVLAEIYGVSYGRLVKMYQMRVIARELRQSEASVRKIAQKYGYEDYSNFKRSFRKEIGVTPREFVNMSIDIPDMPIPKTINGHKLQFRYQHMDQHLVYGYPIPMEKGRETDILEECSYVIEHPDDTFDLNDSREQICFWWSETKDNMYYVHGFREDDVTEIAEGMKGIDFPEYDYAVFSVERGETREDILKTQRMLVKYVMTVWRELNHKVSTIMVYTYETFDPDYTSIYLPIVKDNTEETEDQHIQAREWTSFINKHITEELSLRSLSEYFNYSEQHFHRIFKRNIKMSPAEYILKCRLYLAAKEIREEKGNDTEYIARRYRFKTMRSFRKQFLDEFHVEPEEYHEISVDMMNLTQFYPEDKPEVRINYYHCQELKMLGKTLYTQSTQEVIKEPDIPHLNEFWMKHEYEELKGSPYECTISGKEDKIAFWTFDDNGRQGKSFVLGPVAENISEIPENFEIMSFPEGRYAIFESLYKSDKDRMVEVYSLLIGNGIEKWARENDYQVESKRPVFMRYSNEKMLLYIPVNG